MTEIPKGLCQCGCGRATSIAPRTYSKLGIFKGKPMRFLRGHCVRGDAQWNWKGGRSISNGYVLLRRPGHARARKGSGYVAEHILVVEAALGHALPAKAVVHHFDENKANNKNDNLVVCPNESYHRLLHARMRALLACGNASAIPCRVCCTYENQEAIIMVKGKARVGYHLSCQARRIAGYNAAKRAQGISA